MDIFLKMEVEQLGELQSSSLARSLVTPLKAALSQMIGNTLMNVYLYQYCHNLHNIHSAITLHLFTIHREKKTY